MLQASANASLVLYLYILFKFFLENFFFRANIYRLYFVYHEVLKDNSILNCAYYKNQKGLNENQLSLFLLSIIIKKMTKDKQNCFM